MLVGNQITGLQEIVAYQFVWFMSDYDYDLNSIALVTHLINEWEHMA